MVSREMVAVVVVDETTKMVGVVVVIIWPKWCDQTNYSINKIYWPSNVNGHTHDFLI
jgi:hypothetical protein